MKTLALLAAAVGLAGCNVVHMFHDGPQVKGSGKVKSEGRKVGNFSKVVSAGSADCRITVGPSTKVEIKADDNILPLIETRVENGTLVIECKGNFSTQNNIQVTIQTPKLEAFTTKGSGDTEISGVKGPSFSAEIAGSGSIKGTGQTDRANYSIRGSGDMDFYGLKARNAEASISGSGDIQLFVMVNLEASIKGSGNINYAGKPDNVKKSISGSGEIEER